MKKKNVKYEVGKGSIKRPTNPSDSFRKSKKKTQKQVVAHKASAKKQAWMEKTGKGGSNC